MGYFRPLAFRALPVRIMWKKVTNKLELATARTRLHGVSHVRTESQWVWTDAGTHPYSFGSSRVKDIMADEVT
jgi:hypothetical protein